MAESSTNSTEFAKKAAACDIVRFTFTDINGLPRTKVVPGPQTSYFIQHGVTSWAGVIAIGTQSLVFTKEVQAINEGNATAIPDPQTFHEVIWSSEEDLKIGEVLKGTLSDCSVVVVVVVVVVCLSIIVLVVEDFLQA